MLWERTAKPTWSRYVGKRLTTLSTVSYGKVAIVACLPSKEKGHPVSQIELITGQGRFLVGIASLSDSQVEGGPLGGSMQDTILALVLENELLHMVTAMEAKLGVPIKFLAASEAAIQAKNMRGFPLQARFADGGRIDFRVTPCNRAASKMLGVMLALYDVRSREAA